MTLDQNYIGIDVSKAHLDIFEPSGGRLTRLPNRAEALQQWASGLAEASLVVFEATGGYDLPLRAALERAGIGYVRVNPLRAPARPRLRPLDRPDGQDRPA